MRWQRKSENQMTKYWVSGISVPSEGNPYRWDYYESCQSLAEAIEAINKSRERGDVVTAWVKDDAGELCFHESYVDNIGRIAMPTEDGGCFKGEEKTPKRKEVRENCFCCGGINTVVGYRAALNGHFHGHCEACGCTVIE